MKHFLFLLLAGVSLGVYGQTGKGEPYLVKSLSGESIKNVEVKTSGGSISVSGATAGESRVEVYVNANNSSKTIAPDEIKRRLDEDYDLTIAVSNNKVTAIAKPKRNNMNWKKALNISFKVFAPKNVSTNLATSGGSIRLDNLSGSQDFATSGGSLHVSNLSGKVKGRTSGGSIHVSNSTDEIDLSTSGGSIHADNCSGDLRLSTSGGSFDLSNLKGTIRANTSGGSINGNNIEGELTAGTSGGSINLRDLSCSLETSTSGGHIDVSIKEYGKFVKISNSGGNIDLELPRSKGVDLSLNANKIKTGTLYNFNGNTEETRVNGTLNGGGLPVTVSAGSGRISLSMK